jgi:hypothetical protein
MTKGAVPYGNAWYSGSWRAQDQTITQLRSSGYPVLFLRRGFSPSQCSNYLATVYLPPGGSLGAAAAAQVTWNNPDGSLAFHACPPTNGGFPSDYLFFNLDWSR